MLIRLDSRTTFRGCEGWAPCADFVHWASSIVYKFGSLFCHSICRLTAVLCSVLSLTSVSCLLCCQYTPFSSYLSHPVLNVNFPEMVYWKAFLVLKSHVNFIWEQLIFFPYMTIKICVVNVWVFWGFFWKNTYHQFHFSILWIKSVWIGYLSYTEFYRLFHALWQWVISQASRMQIFLYASF